MDERLGNSRSSSRHAQPVVLPPIEAGNSSTFGRENQNIPEDTSPGRRSSMIARSKLQNDADLKFVLDKLELTHRAFEEERHTRIMLEDNLRTVVVNVQRLSKDMALLQQEVKSEGDSVNSQKLALKNLEMHQMAGIGDVWNRLTVGDLNSIKLSGDLNKVAGELSDQKRGQEDTRRKLDKLQNDVEGLVTKLEKVSLDFEKNLHVLQMKFETMNHSVDERIRKVNDDKMEAVKHAGSEQKVEHYTGLLSNLEQRLDTSLEIHKTWQTSFEDRVGKLEKELTELSESKNKQEEDLVRKIREMSEKQRTALKKSHEKQNGNREAFRAVYESITTMQTVLETKLKMTEADLKASINSILRSIARR